jgi:hypothetical protein
MKNGERFPTPQAAKPSFALGTRFEESEGYKIRGDVFIKMHDARTGELQHEWEKRNLVVMDASILIARLMKDNSEPPFGAFALAVGTGDVGWNPLAPPAPTKTQRALYSELSRKRFARTEFIDGGGAPIASPTNVVDFTTIFTESEAVGPLVEMGLIGGNVSTNLAVRNPVSPPNGPYDPLVDLTTRETLINYLCFPIISKPATSTLTVIWRLTF